MSGEVPAGHGAATRPPGRAAQGPTGPAREVLVGLFRRLNLVMVPVLTSAAGPWVASPLTGYMAVLTTTGRRTGRARQTPLNYAIRDGHVYLLAGFGRRTDWLANLRADPHVVLLLPGRPLSGQARVVTDEAEASSAAVAVARNAGAALAFEGLNPLTVSDDELAAALRGRPVVRLDAATGPVIAGGHDPGGHLWLLPHVVLPAAAYATWRLLRRR